MIYIKENNNLVSILINFLFIKYFFVLVFYNTEMTIILTILNNIGFDR